MGRYLNAIQFLSAWVTTFLCFNFRPFLEADRWCKPRLLGGETDVRHSSSNPGQLLASLQCVWLTFGLHSPRNVVPAVGLERGGVTSANYVNSGGVQGNHDDGRPCANPSINPKGVLSAPFEGNPFDPFFACNLRTRCGRRGRDPQKLLMTY